jgi:hypothetical protein
MGTFSFVVLAEVSDAEALANSSSPLEQFSGYGEKALDPGRWARLAALLGFDQAATSRMANTTPLADGGDDGPWVFEVPGDLLERVAQLDVAQAATTAQSWVAADRIMAIGGAGYASDVITRLSEAARRARIENKPVLVRVSV